MIPVESLLYKIDQKLNKLSTNAHQQIQLEDKILALNEAQIKLIKQKVDGFSTVNGLGLDAFKKRYEDLQGLIVEFDHQPLSLKLKDPNLNSWSAGLVQLDPKYMFYIDAYIIADKGDMCKDRIIWINRELSKHGDITLLLNNEHYKPSFEHQETIHMISSDEMIVFTDGTFTPKKLHLSYLRYPKYIDKQGYVKFDGSLSSNQNCELVPYLEDELLDITVEALAGYIENAGAVAAARGRISTNE